MWSILYQSIIMQHMSKLYFSLYDLQYCYIVPKLTIPSMFYALVSSLYNYSYTLGPLDKNKDYLNTGIMIL